VLWPLANRIEDVLATLRHQRETALCFLRPVSTDVGVRKMPVTDGLNVLSVNELAELPRPNNVGYGATVGRITQN